MEKVFHRVDKPVDFISNSSRFRSICRIFAGFRPTKYRVCKLSTLWIKSVDTRCGGCEGAVFIASQRFNMRAVYYGQQEELWPVSAFLLRVFFRGRGKRLGGNTIRVNIMHGAEGGRWILCTDFSTGVYNGRVVDGMHHLNRLYIWMVR